MEAAPAAKSSTEDDLKSDSKHSGSKEHKGKSDDNKKGGGKGGKGGSKGGGGGKGGGKKGGKGGGTKGGGTKGGKGGSSGGGSKGGHKDKGGSGSKGGGKKGGKGSKGKSHSGGGHEEHAKEVTTALPAPLEAGVLQDLLPALENEARESAALPQDAADADAAAQAKREKLLGQIRAAKSGGAKEKSLMGSWNVFIPARNVHRHPLPKPTAIPILLLVHERTTYLEPALRLYARVRGINSTTLVVSHHGVDPAVFGLVEAVRFCRVRQLLFGSHAGQQGAAALKLHFTWAVTQVFMQLEAQEVLYMEDDYWPTPDLYHHTLWLQGMREAHCPECVGSVLGEHPPDWTERHADAAKWLTASQRALLYKPYVGCSLNSPAGITIPARTWDALRRHADAYCDRHVVAYDDAIHALQNAQSPSRARVLEPGWLTAGYPRCLHVGRCGGISYRANEGDDAAQACNVEHDLESFARAWVVPMLADGALASGEHGLAAAQRSIPKHPRQSWRIDEGVAICRERFVASGTQLPGVAPPLDHNHTLPMKFKEACKNILKE